jgi:hypothetical protein
MGWSYLSQREKDISGNTDYIMYAVPKHRLLDWWYIYTKERNGSPAEISTQW